MSEATLPPEPNDLVLGGIGGVPFLIDAGQHRGWGCLDLVVDVERPGQGSPPPEATGCSRLTLRFSR